MTNSSTANTILALALGSTICFFCYGQLLEAKADNQRIEAIKLGEQKIAAKNNSRHLQFDRQAHAHRFPLRNIQELTLDQGF